jgi:branched-chain amino acid transport system permease protein
MDFTYIVQLTVYALMLGIIYSLIALGFTLIFGIARVVNFAHGEIHMVGAFVVYYLVTAVKLPFFIAVFICAILIGLLGMVLEKVVFRSLRPAEVGTVAEFPTVAVALALVLILPALAAKFCGTTEKGFFSGVSGTVVLGGVFISKERIVIMLFGLATFIGLLLFIWRHKEGRALSAVAQDSEAAVLQGVNLNRAASLSFGIGFGLAGAAGGLLAPLYYVEPTIGTPVLIKTFIVVILGGIGSIMGTLLGGILVGFIESYGRALLGGNLPMLVVFLLVMILLIVRPTGLLGND